MIPRRFLPALLPLPALAQTTALRVLCTGAVEHPLKDAAASFPRPISVETGNGGQVAARIRAGEPFDLVVSAANQVPALVERGALRRDSL
jgi:ABC-type molybdate transport system substrate-binding protein